MQTLRLNKIAERVIVLQSSPSGGVTPVTLYKKKRKKKNKKGYRITRPGQMMMDQMRKMGGNVMDVMNQGRKRMGMKSFPF